MASQLGSAAKRAGSLAAKQTERAKLLKVSLPSAYAALGRQVHSTGGFREDFPEIYAQLDDLHAKVQALEAHSTEKPTSDKLTDKAKAVAAAAKDKGEIQARRLQISQLTTKLGHAAFDKHGKGSGPAEFVAPIEENLARAEALRAEIEEIEEEGEGRIVTPKRILVGGAIAVGMVLILALASFFGTDDSSARNSQSNANGDASNPDQEDGVPSGSRELGVNVGTAGIENMPRWIRDYNASLTSVKCYATNDELVVDFDVDKSRWQETAWIIPLFIRLFDRNGEHLSHFTTSEKFTVFPAVHANYQSRYDNAVTRDVPDHISSKLHSALLQPSGNRLVYGVNTRDLRDAAMVEIGFIQER